MIDDFMTEHDRIEALIGLVFDDRHYHHACECPACLETRESLAPLDLKLVDCISRIVRSSPEQPIPEAT